MKRTHIRINRQNPAVVIASIVAMVALVAFIAVRTINERYNEYNAAWTNYSEALKNCKSDSKTKIPKDLPELVRGARVDGLQERTKELKMLGCQERG